MFLPLEKEGLAISDGFYPTPQAHILYVCSLDGFEFLRYNGAAGVLSRRASIIGAAN